MKFRGLRADEIEVKTMNSVYTLEKIKEEF